MWGERGEVKGDALSGQQMLVKSQRYQGGRASKHAQIRYEGVPIIGK